jgi:hypothetical protein
MNKQDRENLGVKTFLSMVLLIAILVAGLFGVAAWGLVEIVTWVTSQDSADHVVRSIPSWHPVPTWH